MAEEQIRVGDIGTVLEYQFTDSNNNPMNLSGTTYTLTYARPNNTQITVSPSATNAGIGMVQYRSLSTTFTVAGMYKVQGFVDYGDGLRSWKSHIETFKVFPNL